MRSLFSRPLAWFCCPLVLAIAAGCSPYTRVPQLYSPGNAATQRFDAVYHDPYPLEDVGPEVVGGRPREYQRAVPEVTRGRLFRPAQTAVPQPPPAAPQFPTAPQL